VAWQTASKCRGLDSRENQGLTVDGNHTSHPGSAGPQVAVLPPAPASAGAGSPNRHSCTRIFNFNKVMMKFRRGFSRETLGRTVGGGHRSAGSVAALSSSVARRSPRRSRGFSPRHGDGGARRQARNRPGSSRLPAPATTKRELASMRGTRRSRGSRAPSSCRAVPPPAGRPCATDGVSGPTRGGRWTVFRSTSGLDGAWFTVRAGAILSRQMAHVRLGSDLAGWSGRVR